MSDTGLHDALRQGTRHSHRRVDRHPLMRPLVDGSLTLDSYALVLRALLGVHQPLEQAFAACHQTPAMAAFAALPLGRAALLTDDLEHLGPLPASLPQWTGALPTDLPDYVGMRYVLEGSVMGAAILAPRIQAQLGRRAPLAFFGRNDPDIWHRFCCLAEATCPSHQQDQAITAARRLFEDIAAWFDRFAERPVAPR